MEMFKAIKTFTYTKMFLLKLPNKDGNVMFVKVIFRMSQKRFLIQNIELNTTNSIILLTAHLIWTEFGSDIFILINVSVYQSHSTFSKLPATVHAVTILYSCSNSFGYFPNSYPGSCYNIQLYFSCLGVKKDVNRYSLARHYYLFTYNSKNKHLYQINSSQRRIRSIIFK